jgi:hypothetical protein
MLTVDWATFMHEYEEGARTLGSDNWIDTETGRIGFGEIPHEGSRCVRFFEASSDAAQPSGEREHDPTWVVPGLRHRWELMVFARYPTELRLRLEDAHFSFEHESVYLLSAAERRVLKNEYRELLRTALGAKETLDRWHELSRLHSLAKWCAESPLGLEPPPFASRALAWSQEMEREESSYTESLLARLDSWLRTNASPVHASLGAGLSEPEIVAAKTRFGGWFSPGIRALYRWRNGSSERGDFYLNHAFLSMERAERERARMLELRERKGSGPALPWSDAWLPIFDAGTGDLLCFDAEGIDGGLSGQLVDYPHEVPESRTPVFADVESWLETYLGALERGLFTFDGEYLECIDVERFLAFVQTRAAMKRCRTQHRRTSRGGGD